MPRSSAPLRSRAAVVEVKRRLTRWPVVKAAAYVVDDAMWAVRSRLGPLQSDSGSTHLERAAEDSVAYIEEVFADYKRYGGVDRFAGTAAEVGPGDTAGVAMLMRADGCERVDLVDRFRSRRSPEQQREIYRALAGRHDLTALDAPPSWDDERCAGVHWRVGSSAEEFFAACAARGGAEYDAIVSRAVFEHLYDPLGALRSMAAGLKPGGRMIHKIDFRDHGMFTPVHPELTFLRFPASVHRRMTRHSGRPNRVLFASYRQAAERLRRSHGVVTTLLVTSLAGVGEVVPHRPFAELAEAEVTAAVQFVEAHRHRFAREFDGVPSADLAVTGVFLVAVRPALPPNGA